MSFLGNFFSAIVLVATLLALLLYCYLASRSIESDSDCTDSDSEILKFGDPPRIKKNKQFYPSFCKSPFREFSKYVVYDLTYGQHIMNPTQMKTQEKYS